MPTRGPERGSFLRSGGVNGWASRLLGRRQGGLVDRRDFQQFDRCAALHAVLAALEFPSLAAYVVERFSRLERVSQLVASQ